MGLESANYISGLVTSNPTGSDERSQGDDHIRLLKSVLKGTFPNATGPVYFPSSVSAKTANYLVVFPTDGGKVIPVDASGAARTVTLPDMSAASAGMDGFTVTVTKSDSSSNTVTVDGNGSDTIDGAETVVLRSQFEHITLTWAAAISRWISTRYTTGIDGFASGTKMLFQQTSAPLGWTKDTSHDEHVLKVVSGDVSSGGSLDFTAVFTTHEIEGDVEGHELTVAEMPAHRHHLFVDDQKGSTSNSSVGANTQAYEGWLVNDVGYIIQGTSGNPTVGRSAEVGGGDPHTHEFTGGDIELDVKYVDVIIATKD